ncbi:hypothetical protein BC936DRAFT_140218 [Jimgerdemannia flammicorona]|uniref:Peptidase C14 caspase domain-containing protein n=1 Tax=Jimgerdemannia flammicorona TaxID=994334 RepID=A0A433AVR5_9FUNG|nr:hypothetical protein BC936DRAFT_140218 [Jimgerdemannia flammicorona]
MNAHTTPTHALLIDARAGHDARWLNDVLEPHCKNITLLAKETATRENILKGFEDLVNATEADNTAIALIFYSGFGCRQWRGVDKMFLVPYEGDKIDIGEIYKQLKQLESKTTYLLLNCCFHPDPDSTELFSPNNIERLQRSCGLQMLTSSKIGAPTWTGNYPHGKCSVFAAGICKGIANFGVNRFIDYCCKYVHGKTSGQQIPVHLAKTKLLKVGINKVVVIKDDKIITEQLVISKSIVDIKKDGKIGSPNTTVADDVLTIECSDKVTVSESRKNLTEKCLFFKTMLESGLREGTTNCVTLPAIDSETLGHVLDFVNRRPIKKVVSDPMGLYHAAEFVMLPELSKIAIERLSSIEDVSTVLSLLEKERDLYCYGESDLLYNAIFQPLYINVLSIGSLTEFSEYTLGKFFATENTISTPEYILLLCVVDWVWNRCDKHPSDEIRHETLKNIRDGKGGKINIGGKQRKKLEDLMEYINFNYMCPHQHKIAKDVFGIPERFFQGIEYNKPEPKKEVVYYFKMFYGRKDGDPRTGIIGNLSTFNFTVKQINGEVYTVRFNKTDDINELMHKLEVEHNPKQKDFILKLCGTDFNIDDESLILWNIITEHCTVVMEIDPKEW